MGSVSAPGSPQLKATRDGYGDALVELGESKKNVVVLDADLSGSTKTNGFRKIIGWESYRTA